MDRENAVAVGMIVLLLGLLCGAVYGIIVWNASTFVGQFYDVTVVVQAVEHSTRFGQHTNVWCLTYSGSIKYTLVGYLDFEIGKTYRIRFVNEYAFFYMEAWGRVISMEQVEAV